MAQSVQIDQICTYLQGLTSTVASITSSRIYYGEPMREQDGIYIVINSISEVIDRVGKKALVEFRIIGNNENVRKKQLIDLANLITDAIVTNDDTQVYKLGTFEVYKIIEGGTLRMFVDEKNRNMLVKDYIFYFLQ